MREFQAFSTGEACTPATWITVWAFTRRMYAGSARVAAAPISSVRRVVEKVMA
jgi:hypothetical protein